MPLTQQMKKVFRGRLHSLTGGISDLQDPSLLQAQGFLLGDRPLQGKDWPLPTLPRPQGRGAFLISELPSGEEGNLRRERLFQELRLQKIFYPKFVSTKYGHRASQMSPNGKFGQTATVTLASRVTTRDNFSPRGRFALHCLRLEVSLENIIHS